MVRVMALRSLIADRHDLLSGQRNGRIAQEVKSAFINARDDKGHCPEKTIELLGIRQVLLPDEKVKSLRAIVSETRSLTSDFRAAAADRSARYGAESPEAALHSVQVQLTEQTKVNSALELELDLFTNTMNTRVEYYRQLQQVSDTVAPFEGEVSDAVLNIKIGEEEDLNNSIAAAKTKRRYFLHLQTEALSKETRICVICQDHFELGVFTRCGHSFCKADFKLWWSAQ